MQIDDETLDRCAQAIRTQAAARNDRARKWEDLPPALREAYRQEARACIETYRMAARA